MKKSFVVVLTVAVLAAMAVPAFAAERAGVRAHTQASTGPVETPGESAQVQSQTCAGGECSQEQLQVQAQVREQTQTGQDTEEPATPAASGDMIQLQDREQLQDGSCTDDCDGTPDQVRDRLGQDSETSGTEEPDGEPDGWLAKVLLQLKEAFTFMFGRV